MTLWAALRVLARTHPLLTGAFAVALLAAVYFALRIVPVLIFFADPRHQDQPIAGWMTARYVALSYDLPKDVMLTALGLTGPEGRIVTLSDLAQARGVPVQVIRAEVRAAIAAYREVAP
ncbi:hypothetical protein [Pseudoruegeria sp. SK021]|uniref:hypothetical protein n=1 Tax=Pseudoruegeria sp. SK021 TaxID=1933035 RepID=UPI000A2264CF|nr:hypothetical protein [Pseudoruegeria sp. SK021]OSP56151.1 hypothetical protein BV911_04270 [Pseudoruegeria sp. SK021]